MIARTTCQKINVSGRTGEKKTVSAEKIEAEREKTKDDALKAAAEFLNIDVSLLSIVSEEEYLTETEKDLQN